MLAAYNRRRPKWKGHWTLVRRFVSSAETINGFCLAVNTSLAWGAVDKGGLIFIAPNEDFQQTHTMDGYEK